MVFESDVISKKICSICCKLTTSMFKFRQDAHKQDKRLREKLCELLLNKKSIDFSEHSSHRKVSEIDNETIHPTVLDLFQCHPNLNAPADCLEKNMNPVVHIPPDEVKKYFDKRNLNMEEFIQYSELDSYINPKSSAEKATSDTTVFSPKTFSASNYNFVRSKRKENEKLLAPTEDREIQTLGDKDSELLYSTDAHNCNGGIANGEIVDSMNTYNQEYFPEFVELLGHTPAVTTTKSYTLHLCDLCDSLHDSRAQLRKHRIKHRFCQFCKRKFKTVTSKQKHVETICPIKKIMISVGPAVNLERIDLNVSIRNKYQSAFRKFKPLECVKTSLVTEKQAKELTNGVISTDTITSIKDTSLSNIEQGNINRVFTSQPPPLTETIFLSDDEESVIHKNLTPVNPDINIPENNGFLNFLDKSMTDLELIQTLVTKSDISFTENTAQTDLPSGDIKIFEYSNVCILKDLKEHVKYKIPVKIEYGKSWSIEYRSTPYFKPKKKMCLWGGLPVKHFYKNISPSDKTSSRDGTSSLYLPHY